MQNKCNPFQQAAQHLIAGISKKDVGIEFFGFPETKTVGWMSQGNAHSFEKLSPANFTILANAFNTDAGARNILNAQKDAAGAPLSLSRRVELYTYYMYGGLDSTPDLLNGKLALNENYRHEQNCISLGFDSKKIRLSGVVLKPRDIKMIDLMEQDYIDEVIAEELGIVRSTFNYHKKALFTKIGVQSKTALMVAAVRQRVVKSFSKTRVV